MTTYPIIGRNECQWSWGFNISNIGSKVSYNDGNDPAFLPTNLRLGTTFTFPIAEANTLALSVDANKLLVPTRPRQADYKTEEGADDQEAYENALEDWRNTSSISGIFKSFNDAPGGFKEELREITVSVGAEYNYNQQFFLRTGYFYENEMRVTVNTSRSVPVSRSTLCNSMHLTCSPQRKAVLSTKRSAFR